MPDFDVSREQGVDDSHASLLTVTGEVDATTAPHLDDTFDEVFSLGAQLVTLDLTDVAFLDSTGLRNIVRTFHRLDGFVLRPGSASEPPVAGGRQTVTRGVSTSGAAHDTMAIPRLGHRPAMLMDVR